MEGTSRARCGPKIRRSHIGRFAHLLKRSGAILNGERKEKGVKKKRKGSSLYKVHFPSYRQVAFGGRSPSRPLRRHVQPHAGAARRPQVQALGNLFQRQRRLSPHARRNLQLPRVALSPRCPNTNSPPTTPYPPVLINIYNPVNSIPPAFGVPRPSPGTIIIIGGGIIGAGIIVLGGAAAAAAAAGAPVGL